MPSVRFYFRSMHLHHIGLSEASLYEFRSIYTQTVKGAIDSKLGVHLVWQLKEYS
jgi:hypothetical protein